MTRVFYILTNGTRVETLKEAQMSGMGYEQKYETIPSATPAMSEKRKAMRITIK